MTDVPRTSNILFALLLALAGCSVHLESQEIWCRRPDDSSLEFLLIYKGVYAPPGSSIFLLPDSEGNRPTNLEHAVSVADDFQQGRRIGMIGNPFLQFDLDAEVGRKDHPENLLIALDGIVLAAHVAFLDEQQRLCAYQLYRIDRVDRLVEAIDDAYRRVCIRDLERGEEHLSKLGLSDAGTIAAWKRFVESGRRWLSYESGRLEICVPISAERPNELLRSGLAEFLAPANLERLSTRAKTRPQAHAEMTRILSELFAHVETLHVEAESISVSFDIPQGSAFRALDLEADGSKYNDHLKEALVEKGLDLTDAPTIDDVRGLIGAVPSPPK
jgi:hypothetical protein